MISAAVCDTSCGIRILMLYLDTFEALLPKRDPWQRAQNTSQLYLVAWKMWQLTSLSTHFTNSPSIPGLGTDRYIRYASFYFKLLKNIWDFYLILGKATKVLHHEHEHGVDDLVVNVDVGDGHLNVVSNKAVEYTNVPLLKLMRCDIITQQTPAHNTE